MSFAKTMTAVPLLCLLAACGTATASNNDANSNAVGPVTANAVAQTPLPSDPTAFKVGAVLATIQYWDGSRPFMNLIYGSQFVMQNTSPWGGGEKIPDSDYDANGWVKSVPTGYRVLRPLSIPVAGGNFVCKFQGNGTISVSSGPASNVVSSTGQTTFTVAPATYPNPAFVTLAYNVDPTNYIRNIDCREASALATDHIAPEFLTAAQGFKDLRFVKWLPSVESNNGTQAAWGGGTQANPNYLVTWATRNKPGDGDFIGHDGVPVEYMMEAANKAGADPWFNMPWNADDDYITRFATYVRDNLPAGHQVYVEESNEVWNGYYLVWHQAVAEAKVEGLDASYGGDFQLSIERYAEKASHTMDIWKNVFAATGQSSQLVRVAAFQNVQPGYGEMLLKYNNAYQHFDAYATAPYFGFSSSQYPNVTVDQAFNTLLPAEMTDALNFAAQNKALATKYGLRYVTYEGGNGILIPGNLPLLSQIEHDPRMGDVYKSYISQWQSQIGDLLNLFVLTGPISTYGGYGMWDYAGQPLSESPKMQAVQQFLGISATTASAGSGGTTTTSPTITCPDGTVISSTGSCPTPTTTTITCPDGTVIASTSTCPVTSTSSGSTTGGKKSGATKGGGKGRFATV